ncbi:MAG: polymerase factor sigma-70 [Actinomycetia bacterium]|nr:polymerase factor sigma-70 [Actinomycetes bacterium]
MHPSEELLRREYEAFTRHDLDALARIFSDEVIYHIPGTGPLSGEHRGREAVSGRSRHGLSTAAATPLSRTRSGSRRTAFPDLAMGAAVPRLRGPRL